LAAGVSAGPRQGGGHRRRGTITNLFLRREGRLLTPPLGSGLLPGVLRQALLARGAWEAVLRPADFARGEILLGNSLRGLAPARLVE
jgi:4-amino-4-deoxychorismate lyase